MAENDDPDDVPVLNPYEDFPYAVQPLVIGNIASQVRVLALQGIEVVGGVERFEP